MKYACAVIAVIALSAFGCGGDRITDNGLVTGSGSASPGVASIESALATKPAGKIDVCHKTDELDGDGNPVYQKINVSMNGWLNGHQKHGDELPGGEVLDENCEPAGILIPDSFNLLYQFNPDYEEDSPPPIVFDPAESFTFGPGSISIDQNKDVGSHPDPPAAHPYLESRMDLIAAESIDLNTQDFTARVTFENFNTMPEGAELQFDLAWTDESSVPEKAAIEMVKCCTSGPGVLGTWFEPTRPGGLDVDLFVESGTFVIEKSGSDVTLSMEGVGEHTYFGVVGGDIALLSFALITPGEGLIEGHVDVTNYEFTVTEPGGGSGGTGGGSL